MKEWKTPAQWVAVLFILGLIAGSALYSPHAERRLAVEAVRNVAGGAELLSIVKAPWGGRRTTLWCAIIQRPDGLVAVVTHHERIAFMEEVGEVAPYWVGLQSPGEYQMLEACREKLNSSPPALPR